MSKAARPSDKPSPLISTLVLISITTLLSLLALAPVGYELYRNLPPRIGTVDLQALVEEDRLRMIQVLEGRDTHISIAAVTDAQRATASSLTVDFAKRLSQAVDEIGVECGCVLINKAALLGGSADDYTDQIRSRIKR